MSKCIKEKILADEISKKLVLIDDFFTNINKLYNIFSTITKKINTINKEFEKKKKRIKLIKKFRKSNSCCLVFIFLLIICLIVRIIPQNKINSEQFNSSSIKLKVKGIGYKYIFCPDNETFKINYYPNEIYINGNLRNIINSKYYFNQSDNNAELIWYNNINNPSYLFYGCVDVTEIDLSNFNTSEAIDMVYMFNNCSSLTSLNLSNFDTSHVTRMFDMFRSCLSLTSLDLSSFNTSSVTSMVSMFNGCISLSSLIYQILILIMLGI